MADYSIVKKTSSEYSTSAWSGGTTTELGIGPEGSRYADREFLWRISSATVDLEESTFTALPDYDRIIMTLEGTGPLPQRRRVASLKSIRDTFF